MRIVLGMIALAIAITAGYSNQAVGAEVTIKVTAFYPLIGSSGVSEICGKITGEMSPNFRVNIVADPKYNPGPYTVLPNGDGKWCAVVNSVTGTADVKLVKAGATEYEISAVRDLSGSRFVKP